MSRTPPDRDGRRYPEGKPPRSCLDAALLIPFYVVKVTLQFLLGRR